MQLQNKNVQVKYNLIIDEDEMNTIIDALTYGKTYWATTDQASEYQRVLDSLKAFRGPENEPTIKTPLIDGQVDVMPGQYR